MRPLGADEDRAVAFAFRGIDTLGDIHLHGKLPAKWYHSWYHPLVPRSNLLKGKRLDGRGGGIRTPDPLLPKQMRYQTALRPDAASIVSRNVSFQPICSQLAEGINPRRITD